MKKTVRAIGLVLAFAMLMSAVVCFAACKGKDKDKTTVAPSATPNVQGNSGNNNQSGNNSHKVPMTDTQGDKANTGSSIPKNWGIESEDTLVTIVYGGVEYALNASKLFEMDKTEAGAPYNGSNKGLANYNGIRMKDLLASLGIDVENVKFNEIVLHHPYGSSESLSAEMAKISPFECVVSPYKNHTPSDPKDGISFVVTYLEQSTQIKEVSGVVKIEIK